MEDNSQVPPGADNQGDAGSNSNSLGWRSALPDEFKEHEYVKTFTKPGDFVKSALEIKTEHDALKTRMGTALFKPGENATKEEREAFYSALRPEKPDEYEFIPAEGVTHDDQMVKWARETFHQASLTKDQAKVIGESWDKFMVNMDKTSQVEREKAKSEATEALKAELGEEFPAAIELTKRFLRDNAKPEELAVLEEKDIGNNPALARLIFKLAKKTGEDHSPPGGGASKDPVTVGMNYKMDGFKAY
jgi:hypothetical protein